MGSTRAAPYPPTETQIGNAPPSYPPPPPPQPTSYPPPSGINAPAEHQPPYVDGTPVVSFPPVDPPALTPTSHHHHNIPAAAGTYPQHIGDPWSSGLFDCEMNENNAIMTAFFPCVTFGQIAEMMDEGQTSCTMGSFMYVLMVPALLTCWILGSNYRLKLRQRYNLVQAPYEDWAVHLFCPCCALCQEFRELKNRGYDPSLGWMGHLAMQQHKTQTAPPVNQYMDR